MCIFLGLDIDLGANYLGVEEIFGDEEEGRDSSGKGGVDKGEREGEKE